MHGMSQKLCILCLWTFLSNFLFMPSFGSLFPFLYPTIVYCSFIIGYLCESSVAMCLENNCKSVFTSTRSQKENQLQGLHGYFWERVTPLYIVID